MSEKSPSQRLLEVQQEIGKVHKDKKNPYFGSNYADINDVLGATKPILNKHGFTVWQPPIFEDGENLIKTEIVDTKSGEIVISSKIKLPGIEDPQKMGSAITYYRRYALQSLLSLESLDDDGNTASGNKVAEKPTSQATTKAWKKEAKNETHECPTCAAPATRYYGVSKQGKDYNLLQCDEKKDHAKFLEVDPNEMLSF